MVPSSSLLFSQALPNELVFTRDETVTQLFLSLQVPGLLPPLVPPPPEALPPPPVLPTEQLPLDEQVLSAQHTLASGQQNEPQLTGYPFGQLDAVVVLPPDVLFTTQIPCALHEAPAAHTPHWFGVVVVVGAPKTLGV